ncbi:MAG: hypothetical protein ACLRM8_09605 [Alistipes sp.]
MLVNYHFNITGRRHDPALRRPFYGLGIGGKVKVGDEKATSSETKAG